MSKSLLLLASLFLFSLNSQAEVKFNCYALPTPVQVIESGKLNCGIQDKKDLKENMATTVSCIYQSFCEANAPNEKPTILTPSDITGMLSGTMPFNGFKMSMVTCRGDGTYENGKLVSVNCKAPKACQDDVLFNIQMAFNVGASENVIVTSPDTKIKGTNK